MINRRRNALILSIVLLVAGCSRPAAPPAGPAAPSGGSSVSATSPPATARRDPATLKVALLPDESPSTVIKDNEPLKEYLTKRIGKEIELVVTTDYSSMIEAVRHGRIDIAYLGPLSYCLAKSKCDIEPFAAKLQHGATTYQSVIVANAESSIASLADIKGQTMAYGDTASTSSHLIPKSMLVAEGLLVDRGDYKEVFVGNHDAVLINVARGNAQAGGLSKPIYESLIERRVVDPDKVRVVAESKPYPQYPWAMQTDLAADLKQRIKDAFYQLDDKQVLGPLKADGFAPVADEDYEPIRELAKILDLDLSQAK